RRRPEHQRQHARPQHLEDEPRGPREEEAGEDDGAHRDANLAEASPLLTIEASAQQPHARSPPRTGNLRRYAPVEPVKPPPMIGASVLQPPAALASASSATADDAAILDAIRRASPGSR